MYLVYLAALGTASSAGVEGLTGLWTKTGRNRWKLARKCRKWARNGLKLVETGRKQLEMGRKWVETGNILAYLTKVIRRYRRYVWYLWIVCYVCSVALGKPGMLRCIR
jgi:hypothetical protein